MSQLESDTLSSNEDYNLTIVCDTAEWTGNYNLYNVHVHVIYVVLVHVPTFEHSVKTCIGMWIGACTCMINWCMYMYD